MEPKPDRLYGRDAQPDIVYSGDRLKWAAHAARCRLVHIAAQIRLAISAIRRPHSSADWIEQDKRYIAEAWKRRRTAQRAVRHYDSLLAAREAEKVAV